MREQPLPKIRAPGRSAPAGRRRAPRVGPAWAATDARALWWAVAALAGGCGLSTVSAERSEVGQQLVGEPNGRGDGTPDDGNGVSAGSGPYDLTVVGSGFTPHANQGLFVSLVDAGDTRVATGSTTVAPDGSFTVVLPAKLAAGSAYSLAYYADVNGNRLCNAPPVDHSWRADVPAARGPVTLPLSHSSDFRPICAAFGDYSLTFNGTDFGGHRGEMFYIDVVDMADRSQVGEVKSTVVQSDGKLTFGWPGLLAAGRTYGLAYFADVNASMSCDAADHAWLTTLPAAAADVQVTGSHNVAQQPICTMMPTGTLP